MVNHHERYWKIGAFFFSTHPEQIQVCLASLDVTHFWLVSVTLWKVVNAMLGDYHDLRKKKWVKLLNHLVKRWHVYPCLIDPYPRCMKRNKENKSNSNHWWQDIFVYMYMYIYIYIFIPVYNVSIIHIYMYPQQFCIESHLHLGNPKLWESPNFLDLTC